MDSAPLHGDYDRECKPLTGGVLYILFPHRCPSGRARISSGSTVRQTAVGGAPMRRMLLPAVIGFAGVVVATVFAADMFTGTWRVNIAKTTQANATTPIPN